MEEKEIEITTLEQFMDKFGGKEASEFEKIKEILKIRKRNLNIYIDLGYQELLSGNFNNLPEEEKLKLTVEQAEKIKNNRFIRENFHYITVSEMKINNENANENLSKLAKKLDIKSCEFSTFRLYDFLIYYFSNHDFNSILSEFNFDSFNIKAIEFVIEYKNFFSFINDLLKQKYADFEYADFLLEMEQNSQNFFDYLVKKRQEGACYDYVNLKVDLIVYLYIHMKFKEQTSERFWNLTNQEKTMVLSYARDNKFNINITQEHVDLITNTPKIKRNAQNILDSRNKQEQEHDTQNVQAKEIEGNKFNKFCEVIKLFFATLFSLGSIASIIVGAIALVSLLTLPFSPWILIGVGVPVLITALICLGKFANDLINLNSMANQSNVKEENDGSSAISKENNKDENNISRPEVQEKEEDKSEIDLNN